MQKNIITFLFLFCNINFLIAQDTFSGLVSNNVGDPLAFVNVLINGETSNGVVTDIDGKFSIENKEAISFLELRYVGYETLRVEPAKESGVLKITLIEKTYKLEEAVVVAGENPAHRIIRQVTQNRDSNNPEKRAAFSCQTYNKVIVDFVGEKSALIADRAAKKKRLKILEFRDNNMMKMMDQMVDQHFLVMESLTERKFRYPKDNEETVLQNKVSGLQEPRFAALANLIQPFSFYEDLVALGDKKYLNPVSPGSTNKYFFNIEDTLYQKQDSVFIISFKSKKGKSFDALKGVLYINTNGYAIQNVIAEPDRNSFLNIKIEQKYTFEQGRFWFPNQLNYEAVFKKYPDKFLSTKLKGRSYIKKINFDPVFEKETFDEMLFEISDKAHHATDSVWELERSEALSTKEKATYVFMDSVGTAKKFDSKLRFIEGINFGKIAFKKFDIPIEDVIRLNDFEEVRLGFGIETNRYFSKRLFLNGNVGYGFLDESWKYGMGLTYKISRKKDWTLSASVVKDLQEPGNNYLLENSGFVSRQFFATRMDGLEEQKLTIQGWLFKYGQLKMGIKRQELQPLYSYSYNPNNSDAINTEYSITELHVGLRYAFAERFINAFGKKISEGTSYPTIQFVFAKGLSNVLDGNFDYNKYLFRLDQNLSLRNLGTTRIRLDMGYVSGELPASKLFSSNGIGLEFRFLSPFLEFQTMEAYEFLSDRYVHFFFKHKFNSYLYQSKWSSPQFAIAQNIGFGNLENPEAHRFMFFDTMEKGFYESGVLLENLIRIPYLGAMYLDLSFGAFYRYGPYGKTDFKDNVALRASLAISLL